ncbi:histone-lysine N-methyltransferase SUV39H1 isoform X1 [Arapaima gigas]
MAENLNGCSVACKMSLSQLQVLCRQERIFCQQLGVTKKNFNYFEVEYLCNYKKIKVSLAGNRLYCVS